MQIGAGEVGVQGHQPSQCPTGTSLKDNTLEADTGQDQQGNLPSLARFRSARAA